MWLNVEQDDPDIPFTEDDYRRRKPHPNFKEHIAAEKTIMKMGKTNKSKLATYVIASGLTYGGGENIFHFLYKVRIARICDWIEKEAKASTRLFWNDLCDSGPITFVSGKIVKE